jgi:hypothetical protein
MPDELRLQTPGRDTDTLGHTFDTGTYTTAHTTSCRWKDLSGRDLEVARSFAATAQGVVACPNSTPVAVGQRFQVYQAGALALTARVVWIGGGSTPTSQRFYYERVTL